ncbi:MAG: hypothetical protein KKB59_18320 [Spirochaetes bacterium]|nr:hypothetical protein [Spirochaetota bacterium]
MNVERDVIAKWEVMNCPDCGTEMNDEDRDIWLCLNCGTLLYPDEVKEEVEQKMRSISVYTYIKEVSEGE